MNKRKLRRVAIVALVLVLLCNTLGVQASTKKDDPRVIVKDYGSLYTAIAEATSNSSSVGGNTTNTSSVSNTDNSRSESSRTENSNNSSTVNNYYQQDKQEPATASTNASQPVNVTVPVTVSTPEAKGSYTATTEAPESTSIADKNINIEAKGVDVKLEITGDSYNISISAPEGQESQIQPVNEVSTVNTPESTTEPQRSPNWIEYITVILLAVLVGLEIKDKLHKEK